MPTPYRGPARTEATFAPNSRVRIASDYRLRLRDGRDAAGMLATVVRVAGRGYSLVRFDEPVRGGIAEAIVADRGLEAADGGMPT
jgi:hypothetical protein